MKRLSLTLFLLFIPAALLQAEDGFVSLFDGKTLSGWEQKGGKADYVVKDGAIVGTSVPNTPNSFLCTKQTYSDFILEFEMKVHPDLNSGTQIRSNCFEEETEVIWAMERPERFLPVGCMVIRWSWMPISFPAVGWVGFMMKVGVAGCIPAVKGRCRKVH